MALGVKDVIGIIITYLGTKKLGSLPTKPTIGVNIGGTPAMSVDLFAVLGGIFPNLSAAISGALSSTFSSLALNLGLDPANLFMSSPLGTLTNSITAGFDQLVLDFNLTVAEQAASLGAWETSAAALQSATDQVMGLPSTAWSDLASNQFNSAAQFLSPASLTSNIEGTIANSVAIDSCLKPATSTLLLEAAQADFKLLQERVVNAVDATAKDLVKKEFMTKMQDYSKKMDTQLETFNAEAAEIGKKLNAVADMSAQIVPPSINIKGGLAVMTELEKAKAQYTPEQLNAAAAIVARWDAAVLPVFKEQVLPTIDEALAMEAGTSKTATDRLAAASTNITYNDGYPDGVNLRYDTA